MRMSTLAMRMAVRHLFRRGGAHLTHGAGEHQRDAGQRVVGVQRGVQRGRALVDFGDAHQVPSVLTGAFQLHADHHALGQVLQTLGGDEFFVVLPKGFVGLQPDLARSPTDLPSSAASSFGKSPPEPYR